MVYWRLRIALVTVVGLVMAAPAFAAGPAAINVKPDEFGGYASTHIVVRVKPELVQRLPVQRQPNARNTPAARRLNMTPGMQRLAADWNAVNIRPAYPYEFRNPQLAAEFGLDRTFIVDVPKGSNTPDMAAAFRGRGAEVESAAVDVVGGISFVPNDTWFNMLWNMHNTGQSICFLLPGQVPPGNTSCTSGLAGCDINASEAWDLHTGEPGTVTIAIIDSGISDHDDLDGRILVGTNTNDLMNPDLTDDGHGHGTHVAAIAAAAGNDAFGVAGVTWGAHLMPVRVVNSLGQGTALQSANGLIWAVDNGADICNMSLQYYSGSNSVADLLSLESAVNYSIASGAVVVAAAGNDNLGGVGVVSFPARFAGTIAVSSLNNSCARSTGSNHGAEVDVCAPGEKVYSAWLSNEFRSLTGTSMATPAVSGLAALIKSYVPELSNLEIRDAIESTVTDLGPAGHDVDFGLGLINAHAALLAAKPPLQIMASDPPHNAIDARQPFNLDGSNQVGWTSIQLTFDGDAADVTGADFAINIDPLASAPAIASVVPNGDSVIVELQTAVPLASWTTITYLPSNTSVRIGYLPGDVNGNGISNAQDITALIDALNNVVPRPSYATDANRTGVSNAQDILRVIDLLNGAGAFPVFNSLFLPP